MNGKVKPVVASSPKGEEISPQLMHHQGSEQVTQIHYLSNPIDLLKITSSFKKEKISNQNISGYQPRFSQYNILH